ncbi:uncharacterized protein [Euphorbia lathyris]|uniref:uncharacterized protein n=1 Tax=Euphorbia lathyris TaxID=212925 RepID=UPI003314214E
MNCEIAEKIQFASLEHLGFSRFIHEEFNIFEVAKHVVDLCAAPGGWSQVLSCKLYLPAKLSQDSRLWKSKVVLQLAPSLQQQPFKIIGCRYFKTVSSLSKTFVFPN